MCVREEAIDEQKPIEEEQNSIESKSKTEIKISTIKRSEVSREFAKSVEVYFKNFLPQII